MSLNIGANSGTPGRPGASGSGTGVGGKNLVLAAMVFAVAMTFIDQTIVAIAIPKISRELSLSATGAQWVINGYLLSLSALFAFGGKLADVYGRRRMVVIGVIGFAIASACCGLTPKGSIAESWIIAFRVIQGATAALMFPAAVGIVVASFPLRERGKAMAIFFGISGGLTAIGPIAGGFLTQWTWRAIFWVNIPVAIIALVLIWLSKPDDTRRPTKLDYRGAALITAAMGLLVLGLQQSAVWGWSSPATWLCIIAGLVLVVVFVRAEHRISHPLLRLQIFNDQGFAAENVILGLMSIAFVPFFFFGSVYAQVALGKNSSNAGLYLLWFFIGFVIMSQIGGRILDRRGAKPAVVGGSALAALGFFLLAGKLTDLSFSSQQLYIAIAGGGIGLMLGTASTDAVNRAPSGSYSEVTGITQTSRNFGASLGLAVLGTIYTSRNKTNVTAALTSHGVPRSAAERVAASFGSTGATGSSAGAPRTIVHAVQLANAHSTQTVFYIMAGVMAATFLVAVRRLPRGRVEPQEILEDPAPDSRGLAQAAGVGSAAGPAERTSSDPDHGGRSSRPRPASFVVGLPTMRG